jgi:predicted nucleic acid-binding protein
MKSLVFDTSSIISIAMNNLLWVLKELKNRFSGDFYICESVKKEVIDYPLTTKRFKLEALMIQEFLSKGIIKLKINKEVENKARYLLKLANNIFRTNKGYIKILHMGEVESLALAVYLNSDAYVVDERTTRILIENPNFLLKLLENKLHMRVNLDKNKLNEFKKELKNLKIIRSTELMVYAYEQKILDKYVVRDGVKKELKKTLLHGLLWGLRLRGCSISTKEINNILRLES